MAKQLALALHNYHADFGCFPPAFVPDKNGKPMHSWRTLILPYVEENNLYELYNFNEPWDGPNNRKLAIYGLSVFRCPSNETIPDTTTCFAAVTGPGTIWSSEHGTRIKEITDGPSNTILLVELADSGIHWMEPRDITLEEALGKSNNNVTQVPTSKHHTIGGYFYRSLPLAGHIVMADGSVKCFCNHPRADELAAMLSISGGESIDTEHVIQSSAHSDNDIFRRDRYIGLPLFLITLVWLWIRMVEEPGKLKTSHTKD